MKRNVVEFDPNSGWRKDLLLNGKGITPGLHNAMLVLQNDEIWKGVIGYNEHQKRLVFRKPPPWGGAPRPIIDSDETRIANWFGRRDTYAVDFSSRVIREALIAVAEDHPFHPVRDYLESLQWDEKPRIDLFLSACCGAEDQPFLSEFSRNFFIQAVARIFRPGCKADLMLVLEGEQGKGKSTLARVLAGADHYVDMGAAPNDKDFYQIMQGTWIVEISEMASFARADQSHIKRALTVSTDKYRPSYGRISQEYPRESVFIGTVNDDDWQRDPTGARRFMPVRVGDIDIDAVHDLRDQLWAEAVTRFRSGEAWHELSDAARAEQESRYIEDVWAEPIYNWLQGKGRGDRGPVSETSVAEILAHALGVMGKQADKLAQMRVGTIMHRLGWERSRKRRGNTRIYIYKRPDQWGDADD